MVHRVTGELPRIATADSLSTASGALFQEHIFDRLSSIVTFILGGLVSANPTTGLAPRVSKDSVPFNRVGKIQFNGG